MEERRVADYFVVAGLPDNPETLGEFTCDGAVLKASHNQPPITDIAVINRSLGEVVPDGYECIEITPSGQAANLNHGALRAYEVFLCFQRGRDKAPLVDIGVLYEGKERVLADSQIVEFTLAGRSANVNQSGQTTFMTYRRASETAPCNELVVSDICVIMTNKGEKAPHSYCMIDRNLNKGTVVGSDIFVCYKKSMNRSDYVAYKAGIMDHYPHKEHKHFPIPKDLALFCLPMGATLESWPPKASKPDPVFSTFVLTVTMDSSVNSESVEKVYGAAVTFYEKYPHHHLTEEQKDLLKLNEHFGRHNVIHTNKCICFLSHWPFFDTFEKFLRYIHHMTLSGPHSVPLERYISHMLDEVPFPTPRKPRILIQLDATERISLAQPEDSPINLSGAKFRQLLMNLKPEQCLQVLLFALTEQKFLLHSLRPDVLTAVAEAITMLIFPFHWQCPYIPLCPLGLSDFLNAPIPFLLGLDSRFFDLYDPPTDVICIDLDTGAIYIPEEKKYLTTKLLPKRAARVLRNSLQSLCEKIHHFEISRKKNEAKSKGQGDASIDYDFKLKKREHLLDAEIQETFLRFTATTLKGYNNYLLPIVKAPGVGAYDTASLFDVDAFLKSRDKTYQKFYTMMMNTQMFSKFIEERSFVSDKDVSLAFFDDCAEKVLEDDSSIRLLELECAQSEHTSFLLPPEPSGLPAGLTFTYNGFPDLKRELYPMREPKPILPALKNPSTTPGSPLVRRTKHEIKSAQKQATRYAQTPILWAKCLLATCYSLWFTHLPSFALTQSHKSRVLQLAYKILTNMQKLSLTQYDEVCYRVMMQLCGMYSQPVLAVDVLCEMKRHGIQPNAITYGYYNRAVMENKWTRSKLLWNKLRNVIIALSVFKRSGQERARRVSSISLDEVDKASTDIDSMSRLSMESATSLDSHLMPPNKTDTLSSDPGYSSVSETSESVSSPDGTTTTVTTTQAKVGMNNNIIINNTKKQMLAREGKGGSTSECGSTSGVWRALDFTESDAFRTRLGSILRSSASGLACGANLSLIEHNPAFNNSAGLLMTSQLNDSVFDEAARSRPRPTDLAAALSPTLDKYDRMSESSSSRMSPESSSSDRVPEYLRSDSYGSDAKMLTNLLQLAKGQQEIELSKGEQVVSRTLYAFVATDTTPTKEHQESMSRSMDSLSDIEEEEPEARGGAVRSFFTRNTPERLSNLFKRSVDSADEKIRGFLRKSVSRSSSKDSVNLEQGVKDYFNGSREESEERSNDSKSLDSLDLDEGAFRKSHEVFTPTTTPSETCSEPSSLQVPVVTVPRSSSINISRSLNKSPVPSSPSFTPVTQNDPLGAFSPPLVTTRNNCTTSSTTTTSLPAPSTSSVIVNSKDQVMSHTSTPNADTVLLPSTGRKAPKLSNVTRSATFTAEGGRGGRRQAVQRSSSSSFVETPASAHHSSTHNPSADSTYSALIAATPSLSAISTKLSFSANSKFGAASSLASHSIRQATKQIEQLRVQYIDPTVADLAQQYGPSNIKNELLSGGLNSMKSGFTALSKKCIELREAISATNTSMRGNIPRYPEENIDEDCVDMRGSRRESADVYSQEDTVIGGPNLYSGLPLGVDSTDSVVGTAQQDLFPPLGWDAPGPFAMSISLTTCTKCHNCSSLLFDEDIMAGWRPDDSNLNTKCAFCERMMVPLLTITMCDVRHEPRPDYVEQVASSKSDESADAIEHPLPTEEEDKKRRKTEPLSKEESLLHIKKKGMVLEPLTVPYLSPLVLRKELETVLSSEGDACLNVSDFTDHHPILYWNLLWYFARIHVPSHLPGLSLGASCASRNKSIHPSWADADWRNVHVVCMWDNPKNHEELGQPMYVQWQQQEVPSTLFSALVRDRARIPRDVMQGIIAAMHVDDLTTSLTALVKEVRKRQSQRHYPFYRDLLFLAASNFSAPPLNFTAFDREYRRAYERIERSCMKVLSKSDSPPSIAAVFCRRYFCQLSL
ncbi:DENN domain-containing protein Crag isoform X3 [Oratosquilla oratoria]|uniref:DENN domain-containing protein Crag isoform X3 n=1 Tax=Oratosquilla oratoria TaxID=337810 RepID=UPI003F76C6AC